MALTRFSHTLPRGLARIALLAVAVMLSLQVGSAQAASGGATVVATPKSQANAMIVRKISCLTGCASIAAAQPGATLRFQGPQLNRGRRVVYLGGSGPEDDVLAKLTVRKRGKERLVTAVVPKRAASGPVAIEVDEGARSAASAERVVLPEPVRTIAAIEGNGPFFPVRGKYRFGTGTASFGGGRGHQGHDVFADCGTPLVAAEGGTVVMKKFHARGGHYIVIDVDGADRAAAYMHLVAPALFEIGDTVRAGEQIGAVGDTGRADGCHLHFELWIGRWQGLGGPGRPIDPLPTLREWARIGVRAAR